MVPEVTEVEEAKTCGGCQYFRRHYVKAGKNWYLPLDKGHCVHPRLKDREAETPACRRFRERKP